MNKKISIILVLSIVLLAKVNAQKIITDRPDQTEASSTVPQNSFQIESGILIEHIENNTTKERNILAPSTLFRYGLTDGIEIRVLSQYESNNLKTGNISTNNSGISDLELGTKVQLFKNDANIEIAFLTHLIIPTGSEDFTNDNFGTINKFAISHSITEKVNLGYNVGYNNFGTGSGDLTYSLALGFGITDKLGIYIEPFGEFVEFDSHRANFDSGLTYLVKENLQLDFSFGTGINHTMNYISFGFSWNIAELNK